MTIPPIKYLWSPPPEGSWASAPDETWERLVVVKQTDSYTYFDAPAGWPLFYRTHSPLRVRTADLWNHGAARTLGAAGGKYVYLAPEAAR